MKHFFLFFLIIFSSGYSLFAGTKFYRASYRDDPSTTIVISWCDNGTSTNAMVYYGTTDFGTNYANYPNTHGIDRTASHEGLTHRHARLTSLTPNTIYYFVVRDDQGASVRMTFKTLSDDPNVPVMFISGGDTRTGVNLVEFETDQCIPRRQRGNVLVAKIRPDFVASSGDYVFDGDNDGQWSDWFSDWQLTIAGVDKRVIPIVPVFGNHEDAEDVEIMFDVPNVNVYYALSFGGNLFRMYNLNSDLGCDATQVNWFTSDLQAHTGTSSATYWKGVQYHVPLVPHGEYSPMTSLISCWAPLWNTYDLRLAMEGHTHVMKWTYPIITSSGTGSDNGFIRNDSLGAVIIGEGTWGAPLRDLYTNYSSEKAFNWTRNQAKTSGFFTVLVTKQKISIQSVLFNNASQVASVGQVQPNDPPGTLPSGLTFWNPSNGNVVEILSNHSFNNDATLVSLSTSSGILTPVFNSNTQTYQCLVPAGTTTIPTTTAVPTDPNAVASITNATDISGSQTDRTTYILVTAEDGVTTKLYTVEFVIGQPVSTLATLTTSMGSLFPVFNTDSLQYTVFLPFGTTGIPVVSATTTDPAASLAITQPLATDGFASVKVISADLQDSSLYMVDYQVMSDTAREIVYFGLPGQSGSVILPTDTIRVYMPTGSTLNGLVPSVIHTGISLTPLATLPQDFNDTIQYTVSSSTAATRTYTVVTEIVNSTSDATLMYLSTNASILDPVFEPMVTNYACAFDVYVSPVTITAIASNPAATVKVFLPVNITGTLAQRTGSVLVIAPDGITTKLYRIVYGSTSELTSNELAALISIYPNPSYDNFNVHIPVLEHPVSYVLFDGLGHAVASESNIESREFTVNASSLPTGAYYIMIRTTMPDDVITFKLIKK